MPGLGVSAPSAGPGDLRWVMADPPGRVGIQLSGPGWAALGIASLGPPSEGEPGGRWRWTEELPVGCPTPIIGLKEPFKDLEIVGDRGTAHGCHPVTKPNSLLGDHSVRGRHPEALPGGGAGGEAGGQRSWCTARSARVDARGGLGCWVGVLGVSGAWRLVPSARYPLGVTCSQHNLPAPPSTSPCGTASIEVQAQGPALPPPVAQLGAWRGLISPHSPEEPVL